MQFERPKYLQELVSSIGNGMIKVITGPRRSGKSYLLNPIFTEYLLAHGIPKDRIFMLDLSDDRNEELHNPISLGKKVRSILPREGQAFLFIDEIQLCESIESPYFEGVQTVSGKKPMITFYSVLNGLLSSNRNVDVYVTGSNSHMLSSDIATEFRGRGWQIHMHPLSFGELREATPTSVNDFDLWNSFYRWGGLPGCALLATEKEKRAYLKDVFLTTYIRDVADRHALRNEHSLEEVTSFLSTSVGSLISADKLANTFRSKENSHISPDTVRKYFDYLEDAFLVSKAQRYDLKGKETIGGTAKYYFQDLGLRSAAAGFKGMDQEPHFMENAIYNELQARGYQVNVGVISTNEMVNGRQTRVNREVDFVVETHGRRFYIQSAYWIPDAAKLSQEKAAFRRIGDGFTKIIVSKFTDGISSDEDGVVRIGLFDFLKNETLLDAPLF